MHVFQAIETKYLGPTNHRPGRVVATAGDKFRLVVFWAHELDVADNHMAAAQKLADKLEWTGELRLGSTKGGYVAVFV